jgi:thiamine-phosphate pyrophosphorylase
MKLIVISSPRNIPREAEIINQLFEAGLEILHLRKPECCKEQVHQLLRTIDPAHHAKVALHQFHNSREDFQLKRLHFTEQARNSLKPEVIRQLKNEGYILSTSTHAIENLQHLQDFHYAFFSPVFNSISKSGYNGTATSNLSLSKIAAPIVALGGINAQNISSVGNMGFSGSAVLGAIWQYPEKAIENFIQLKELCRETVPM